MNLYNKYRPFQLKDIVGQNHFVSTILNSSKNNKFTHSYVLGGVKGTGKTSSARIIANLVNCSAPREGELCGICRACQIVKTGGSPDVIEVDGGQKRSVEDILPILSSLEYAPQELKKKVVIIDEAHLLSSTAITSLLKMVEEPPSYVIFVFCTTEINKIPETILSRSYRFLFKKISNLEISKRLKFIADLEKILIEDDALVEIARLSSGSLRDSISLLEQVSTSVENTSIITSKYVQDYFGTFSGSGLYDLVEEMINQNYSEVLNTTNAIYCIGVDIKAFLYNISEVFRSIMLTKAGKGKIEIADITEEEKTKVQKFSDKLKYSQIDSASKIFASLHKEIDYNINPKWVLESAIIRTMAALRKEEAK